MRSSPKPSAGSSEARSQYRHFFLILIGAVLVFVGLVAVFVLAMHYKRDADKAAKERRYRRSFLPYMDDAEGTLASAQAALLEAGEDVLANARNRVRTSKAFLDRIIAQFPDYPEAHRMRGRLFLFLREFDDADSDFDAYQRLIGDDHKLVYFDRSNGAALRTLREATLEPPMDLLLTGGAKRAKELHAYLDWVQDTTRLENDKMVDLNKVMYAKSLLHFFSGELHDAAWGLDAAEYFRADDPLVYALMAVCHLYETTEPTPSETPPLQRAETAIAAGLKLSQHVPELWGIRGVLDLRSGRAKAAAEAFERAIRLDPSYFQALTGLGRALHAMGRAKEAASMLTDALDGEKASGASRSWLIRLARARAHAAVFRAADEPEAAREKHMTEALADLAAAEELDRSRGEVVTERSSLYAEKNQLDRALKELDRFLNVHTGNLEVRLCRAELRLRAGQNAGAREDVERLENMLKEGGLPIDPRIAELKKRLQEK